MRRGERALPCAFVALVAATSAACAIPLESGDDLAQGGGGASSASGPPIAPGCAPFPDAQAPLDGAGTSLVEADGSASWFFGAQRFDVAAGASPCSSSDPGHAFSIDASALGDGVTATLMTAAADLAYVSAYELDASAPFGVRSLGFGVATRDGDAYVAHALLWTADRPAFGAGLLVEDGFVYAYGCRTGAAFLSNDCFLARAPEAQAAEADAYGYADGGGHWLADVDDAAVLFTAGPSVSVSRDAATGLYFMTYAGSLATTLSARVGVAPEGPWSGEQALASCDVSSGAFCAGAVQHPEIAPAGHVALSYSKATFTASGAPASAGAPELVVLPAPSLP